MLRYISIVDHGLYVLLLRYEDAGHFMNTSFPDLLEMVTAKIKALATMTQS